MSKKIIFTEKSPAAIGAYSQGVACGNLVFTSGQIPLHPVSGEVVGTTVAEQAVQVLENLKAVLEAAGSSLDAVVKTTVFLTDMADFAEVNKVYSTYFVQDFPARTCVAVKTLPRNLLIEIEAIGFIK